MVYNQRHTPLRDQYIGNHILRETFPINNSIPSLFHRPTLHKQQNKQRKVYNQDEYNELVKPFLQFAELRQPQQKEIYRDLGDGEVKNRLHPIQVIPLEEHLEIIVG